MKRFLALVFLLTSCSQRESPVPQSLDSMHVQTLPPSAVGELRLQYHPPQGLLLRCRAQQEERLDDDSLHVRVRTELHFTEMVDSVLRDGSFVVVIRYDSIAVEQRAWTRDSTKQQVVRYRSTDRAGEQGFEMLSAAIGERVRAVIAPNGTLRSITGVGGIARKVLGATLDSLSAEQRSLVDEQLGGELYGQLLVQQFLLLPDSTLDSSHRWTRTVEQPLSPLFTAAATARYAVDTVQRRGNDTLATITAQLRGAITVRSEEQKRSVRIRTGRVSGAARGVLSRKLGMMISRSNDLEYVLVAEVTHAGKSLRLQQRKRTVFQLTAEPQLPQ